MEIDALNDALGMQAISIRLPKEMIEAYKLIAAHHGVGYQPLMRDVLQRLLDVGLSTTQPTNHNRRSASKLIAASARV